MRASRTGTTLIMLGLIALLTGCAGPARRAVAPLPLPDGPEAVHAPINADLPVLPAAGSGRGGYYQDDGPGESPPGGLREVPDAIVRAEPYARGPNRPYVVFGKRYVPVVNDEPFVQRGVGSWYGKKFHGRQTASGEIYDMYKMTAAHPTLPIPSYARITNVSSGKQVVVRINDRGPFHAGRIVDLSYTAALKLGFLGKGSHEVELERLLPVEHDVARAAKRRNNPSPEPASAPASIAALMLDDRDPSAQAPLEGYYVQLGAFGGAEQAARVRAQIGQLGDALGTLVVEQAGMLHRLFSGPFDSRAAAAAAARALPAALGIVPIVVKR